MSARFFRPHDNDAAAPPSLFLMLEEAGAATTRAEQETESERLRLLFDLLSRAANGRLPMNEDFAPARAR